jgi:hypothetical protein
MLNAYDKRLVELAPKAECLVRLHRQNVWHDDVAAADRHCRALHRVKKSATFRALCQRNDDHCRWLHSERLLSMYA